MKKLLLVVVCCLAIIGCGKKAMASDLNLPDLLKKLPAVNQAVIYSFSDSELQYATTINVATLLDKKINIDVGYTPKQEVIASATYKLLAVKDYIQFPILDLVEIEPGLYVGLNRIGISDGNNEFSLGAIVKIISVKF